MAHVDLLVGVSEGAMLHEFIRGIWNHIGVRF